MLEKYQQKLNKIFKENQVVLAYLFGSAAREKTNSLSDIDIAVLFSEKVKKEDYFDKRLKLASGIDKTFGIYKTEVICLNEASPFLKHEAVFNGILIFTRDFNLKREFELRVLQEFEDFKYHLETANEVMKKQIRTGTFGKPLISIYSLYGKSN